MQPPIPRNLFCLIVSQFRARTISTALVLLLALLPLRVGATSVVPPKFEELVNESDYIVRAVVKSVTSEWREKQGQRRIYTFVELEVREVIAGTPPQPLVLRMLGGRVDGEELVIEGAPKFEVGQEDVLFIRGNGRQFYPLTAVMHGRYPILKETATGRAYIARANRAPLTAVGEVSQPLPETAATESKDAATAISRALSPESFIQSIRNSVNPNYRASHAK